MYKDEKEIEINTIIKYEYDSELEKIKEIIKQLIDLKGIVEININREEK